MAQPYVGEIRMFGGNFAPVGWALCNGQLLAISDNNVLFTLLGTTYGGNGITTFGLPDLRGRIPIHQGNGFVMGQSAGVESVTLTVSQIPSHTHVPRCQTAGTDSSNPTNRVWAPATANYFSAAAPNTNMNAAAVATDGGSNQAHNNMMPYVSINFIISLFGLFPSP